MKTQKGSGHIQNREIFGYVDLLISTSFVAENKTSRL